MKQLLIMLLTIPLMIASTAAAQTETNESPMEGSVSVAGCIVEAQTAAVVADVCLGQVATACGDEHPEALAIPGSCWERELAEWDTLMNNELAVILSEIETADIAEAEAILRRSQQVWLSQRDLDCTVAVISTPRTYDSVGPACRTAMTSRRALAIRELRGADWSSP